MSWSIVPQIEKVRKVETEVLCKHLKAFPIENAGELAFGRFKFMMLRVILQHKIEGKQHVITYNDRGGFNTFIYHWPSKSQGQNSFGSLESLEKFLRPRGEIADQVVQVLSQRIESLSGLRDAALEAKQAKAAVKAAKEAEKQEKLAAKAAKQAAKEAKRLAA